MIYHFNIGKIHEHPLPHRQPPLPLCGVSPKGGHKNTGGDEIVPHWGKMSSAARQKGDKNPKKTKIYYNSLLFDKLFPMKTPMRVQIISFRSTKTPMRVQIISFRSSQTQHRSFGFQYRSSRTQHRLCQRQHRSC